MVTLQSIQAWQWEFPATTHRAKVPIIPIAERWLLAELMNKVSLTSDEKALKSALWKKLKYRLDRELPENPRYGKN